MKRSGFAVRQRAPMKRGGRLRPKRLKPGVTGRDSLERDEWRDLVQRLRRRAMGRCEVPSCRVLGPVLDPHHVVKRSQGGADALSNLALLCRAHHEQTDAAYDSETGRLVVVMAEGFAGWRPTFRTLFVDPRAGRRTLRPRRSVDLAPWR